MTLKEFTQTHTEVFEMADVVSLVDEDGVELEYGDLGNKDLECLKVTNYQQDGSYLEISVEWNCDIKAKNFLAKYGIKMTIKREGAYINALWDNELRYRYRVYVTRGDKRWNFTFWGSVAGYCNGEEITEYDVLACLEKYEVPYTVEEFASEFCYNYDPYEDPKEARKIRKIHKAVQNEHNKVMWIFGDVIEELRKIY